MESQIAERSNEQTKIDFEEKFEAFYNEAFSFFEKEDYKSAVQPLRKMAFELIVLDLPKNFQDKYEDLKNKILTNTKYSEYYFPALVEKDCGADYLETITEEFQENANTEDILLKVFLVTYNHETTVAKCIESLVNQKTQYKYKIYILEDCSTDNTLAVCKEYKEKYPELIEIIAQPVNTFNTDNRHFHTALRTLLDKKYWTAIEGDDYWVDEYKIQTAITFLENNLEYVGIGSNWIYNTLATGEKKLGVMPHNYIKSRFTVDNYTYLHTSTRVYRNVVDFASMPRSRVIRDVFIYFDFLLAGTFYYYNKVTSVYNVGTGIWTSLSEEEKKEKNANIRLEFLQRAKDYYLSIANNSNNLINLVRYFDAKNASYNDSLTNFILQNEKKHQIPLQDLDELAVKIEELVKTTSCWEKKIEEKLASIEKVNLLEKKLEELEQTVLLQQKIINKSFSIRLKKSFSRFRNKIRNSFKKAQ